MASKSPAAKGRPGKDKTGKDKKNKSPLAGNPLLMLIDPTMKNNRLAIKVKIH